MHDRTINALRDLALTFEKTNIQIAYELMELAHKARPEGLFIKKKLMSYDRILNLTPAQKKLIQLVDAGRIAFIPLGFRCFTSDIINSRFGVQQASLPFDSGFFSPYSIASIFNNPQIELRVDDMMTHAVCTKTEEYQDDTYGLGILFESSSYDHINAIATSHDVENINHYLDSTFGYYTLDKQHKFVLAHYNWHRLATDKKSNGIRNPKDNLPLINTMINKRIRRMIDKCNSAEHVFFIHFENQNYKYIKIDNEYFFLNSFTELEESLKEKYNFNYSIYNAADVTADDLVDTLQNKAIVA